MPDLIQDDSDEDSVEKKEEPHKIIGGLFQKVYENMTDPSEWLTHSRNIIYHSDTSFLNLLISEACEEKDMFKRIFKAIRLFHYLEFKSNLMKTNPKFLKTVYEKTVEFINDADFRIEKYRNNEYLCKAFEILKETCLSVQKVIHTF